MKNNFAKCTPINLSNLASYSDKMSISQVIIFFKRAGVTFTRTKIQNYLRVGVLPPLFEKRHYTKTHIIFLALIYTLKETYSLDEIKSIFAIMGEPNEAVVQELYKIYTALNQDALKHFLTTTDFIEKNTGSALGNSPALQNFISALLLSTIGLAAKATVLEICNE